MKEIWKDIPDTNGMYKVSNFGSVFSAKSKKKLSICKAKKGYCVCNISKNGNTKTTYVHRLVAKAFIPNPKKKLQVNHIDGNKQNNNIENLEWCTDKENKDHALKNGLITDQIGESNYASKINKEKALTIRKLCNEGDYTQKEISCILNVSKSIVSDVHRRKSWKHI